MHARWELPLATQVFVAVFVWCLLIANWPTHLLIQFSLVSSSVRIKTNKKKEKTNKKTPYFNWKMWICKKYNTKKPEPEIYTRYIYDVIGATSMSHNQLLHINFVQNLHSVVKFTDEIWEVHCLQLTTCIHYKATDSHPTMTTIHLTIAVQKQQPFVFSVPENVLPEMVEFFIQRYCLKTVKNALQNVKPTPNKMEKPLKRDWSSFFCTTHLPNVYTESSNLTEVSCWTVLMWQSSVKHHQLHTNGTPASVTCLCDLNWVC